MRECQPDAGDVVHREPRWRRLVLLVRHVPAIADVIDAGANLARIVSQQVLSTGVQRPVTQAAHGRIERSLLLRRAIVLRDQIAPRDIELVGERERDRGVEPRALAHAVGRPERAHLRAPARRQDADPVADCDRP